jgi:hypothetical protein
MASQLELEMVSEMEQEMVSELDMASGMPLESKLIHWACLFRRDLQCLIRSSSLLFTVFV